MPRADEAQLQKRKWLTWHASCMYGRAEFLHRHKGWEKQDKEILIVPRQREAVRVGDTNANKCQ